MTVEQCLQHTVEAFHHVKQDIVRLTVFHKVGEVLILVFRDVELAGHRLKHFQTLMAVALTKLHESQQQQSFL